MGGRSRLRELFLGYGCLRWRGKDGDRRVDTLEELPDCFADVSQVSALSAQRDQARDLSQRLFHFFGGRFSVQRSIVLPECLRVPLVGGLDQLEQEEVFLDHLHIETPNHRVGFVAGDLLRQGSQSLNSLYHLCNRETRILQTRLAPLAERRQAFALSRLCHPCLQALLALFI